MSEYDKARYFDLGVKVFDPVILVASFALLLVIIADEVFEVSGDLHNIFIILDVLIWCVFFSEIVILTYLSKDRKGYWRKNWIDVVVVVLSVIPFLFSGLALARTIRLLRILSVALKSVGETKTFFVKHKLVHFLAGFAILVIVLGLMGAAFEIKSPDSNITDYEQGIWWALVSVTTVGYGDFYPVTVEGRIVAAVLMIIGIAVFSIFSGTIAAFFIEEDEEEFQVEMRAKMDRQDRLLLIIILGVEEVQNMANDEVEQKVLELTEN